MDTDSTCLTITRQQLAEILINGSQQPICICVLSNKKLTQLNQLRQTLRVPLFEGDEVWLYPNVIEKLRCKRLVSDRRSPEKVATAILRVLVAKQTRILPSRHVHIQSLDILKPDGRKADVLYLGKIGKRISLKSAYLQDAMDINKFASGGAVQPPMNSVLT